MIEYLMVFPDRDVAAGVADELDDEDFTSVRVLPESLAGEDDGESVDWVVNVAVDTIDDPLGAVARALADRFRALAQERGGWLDEQESAGD